MNDQPVLQCALRGSPLSSLIDYLLRDLHSASEKSEESFVEFQCSDGTRHIHRLILKTKLPDFDETKRSIPVTAAIFELVVQYLYKGVMTSDESNELIEVFKAAKYLDCTDLQWEIRHAFQCRLPKFLRNPEFLKELPCDTADDLAGVFLGLRFNDATVVNLAQRLAPCLTNPFLREAVFSCRGWRRMACITGNVLRDAMTSQRLPCKVAFSLYQCSRAIIFDGKFFAPDLSYASLMVLDVTTGEILQKIEKRGVKGVTFSRGEIYTWTSSEIYLLVSDDTSGDYSHELVVTSNNMVDVCVVKRTVDGIMFAKGSEKGVKVINATGKPPFAEQTTIREDANWVLVGAHENAVLVMTSDHVLDLQTWKTVACRGSSAKVIDGIVFGIQVRYPKGILSGFYDLEIFRTDVESGERGVSGIERYYDERCKQSLIPCF